MRIITAASIRLLFIVTLVAISVVAQTGLISASAPSSSAVRTTRVLETRSARTCSISEESVRNAIAPAIAGRVACAPRDPEGHAVTNGLPK